MLLALISVCFWCVQVGPWVLGVFAGGLGFFLMGLKQVGTSLRSMEGKRLRHGLSYLASSPTLGFLSGLAVTGLSNSLTLVSVLLVQFVLCWFALLRAVCARVDGRLEWVPPSSDSLVVLNVTKLGLPMFGVAFIAEFWMGGDLRDTPSAE